MWTKEAPEQPGFYWFRYPQMVPIDRDDNPTIVRVMGSRAAPGFLTCAFPGNEDCPQPINIPGDPEWWSEPICPPDGRILIIGVDHGAPEGDRAGAFDHTNATELELDSILQRKPNGGLE